MIRERSILKRDQGKRNRTTVMTDKNEMAIIWWKIFMTEFIRY